jgi:hypothetical protein
MSHVQTYTIVITHGDSIDPWVVDAAVENFLDDLDSAMFDHTSVAQSYNISVNGTTTHDFEGQVVCPRCGEPYNEHTDGSWNNDGSDACSSCYHNARRGGWTGDRLPLDTHAERV